MYAVIKAGGHQYRVSEGDKVTIDSMQGKVGDKLVFDQVLMVGGSKRTIGTPLVKGAKVEATISAQGRAKKIIVFKYSRRKNSKKTRGHRQNFTEVEIGKISG